MKKYIVAVIISTAIAYQPAQAQGYYNYEQVGRNTPDYIEYDGARYARVPQQTQPAISQPRQKQPPKETKYYKLVEQPENNINEASSFTPRFYIGADVSLNKIKISSYQGEDTLIKDKNNALTGVIGFHVNPYVTLEAFYQKANDADKSTSYQDEDASVKLDTSLSYTAFGIDFLFTAPVNDKVTIFFGPGWAHYDFDLNIDAAIYDMVSGLYYKNSGSDSLSTGAIRFNIGFQYEIHKDLYLRAMARYIDFQEDSILTDMKEFSLGLRYYF